MNGPADLSSSTSSASSATLTVAADSAVADYSHSLGGELAIMPSSSSRDAQGLDGRRPTETMHSEAAA